MRRIVTFLISALSIAIPASATAQRVESISEGAKIRVSTAANTSHVGYLDSLTHDTLAMRVIGRDKRASSLSVGRRQVTRLDVRGTNRFKGALKGAVMGLGAGFLSGFLLGAATHDSPEGCWFACSAVESGMILGIFGGVVAAPIGLVAGASQGAGTWKRVNPATATSK